MKRSKRSRLSAPSRFAALFATFFASACSGPAPLVLEKEPLPPAAPVAALPPEFPEQADEPFRYHPPIPGEFVPMTAPVVEEMRLANGIRALIAPNPDSPIVTVNVVIRWKSPPSVHPTAMSTVLLDAAPKGGKSLRTRLTDAMAVAPFVQSAQMTGITLAFSVLPDKLEQALAALADGLSRPLSPTDDLEPLRSKLPQNGLSTTTSLLGRMQGLAFPAGHPLHEENLLPASEVRLDEVARLRDAALRPETLTLCFAGGVTRDSLSPILERTAGAMKAKGAAPAPKKIPQLVPGHGVFLFEAPEGDAAGGLLTPAPMLSSIDYPAFALAFRVAQAILADERKEEDGGPGEFYVLTFPDATLFAAVVLGRAPRISSYVIDTLAALKRVGEGQFSAENLARARREVTKQSLDLLDRTPDIAARLADVAQYDWPADNAIKRYNAAISTPREDVIKAAQRWFTREDTRIVAAGNTKELEAALEPIGITPVAIVPEKSDKGKKGKGKTK